MTGEPIDRLDPDIAELLRAVEPYPHAPREVQARVAAALAHSIASSNTGESSEDSDTGGAPTAPKTSGIVALGARPLRTIAGTFLIGAAVGATVLAVVRPPREHIVYVEKTPLPPDAVTQPDDVEHVAPPMAAPTVAPALSVGRARVVSENAGKSEKAQPRGSSDLGAEQVLLDVARRALAQGRTDQALAPLDRFFQRYPRSLSRGSVEAALGAIPR